MILTAGRDNYIKFWDYEEIDDVEPEEDLISEISLVKSIHIFKGANIISINTEFFETEHFLLIKASNGKILKLIFKDFEILRSQKTMKRKDFTKIVQGKSCRLFIIIEVS